MVLLVAPAAWSQSNYWDINGSTANAGGATPSGTWNTSQAFWNNATGTGTPYVWGNTGLETAVFAAGTDATGSYTVTLGAGGPINLAALQINLGTVTLAAATASDVLNFGNSTSSIFTASGTILTIGAVINGSAGITKTGTGTLVLATANNYTGTTAVNAGTLTLDFSQSISPATNIINSASSFTLGGNSTLILAGGTGATNSQSFNGLTVNSGLDTITLTQNGATSLSASFGSITRGGAGAVVTFNLPTAGTISTSASNDASGILGAWALVNSGAAYATVSGGNIVAYGGGTTGSANLTNVTSATTNYTFTGAQTLAGARTANTLQFTTDTATRILALGANTLTLNGLLNTSGQTLTISGAGTVAVGSASDLVIAGTNNVTLSSAITGTGKGLTYAGSGTLTLNTAVSTYTGTTTVNSGTLALGLANVLNSASSIVVNGGTLGATTFAQSVHSVSLRGGSITGTSGALTSATTFDVQSGTVSAVLAGTVGLNKTTIGTVTLTGASTYSGVTTLDAGILNAKTFAAVNTASSIGAGSAGGSAADLVFGGGTLQYSTAAVASTNRLFTIGDANGNSAMIDSSAAAVANGLSFTGTGSIGFVNTTAHTITLTGTNTGTANIFAPIIGDQSAGNLTSLNKTGAGTWQLTGANTYTGVTTIDAGILISGNFANINTASGIGAGSAVGSAGDLVFGGGTLQYSSAAVASTNRLFTIGDANGNSATITSSATSATNTLSFTSTGSIAFANTSAHSLTLSGTNTGTNTFAPIISDQSVGNATSLIKSAAGNWVLTGNSTYTGTTTVTGGTLTLGVTNAIGSNSAFTITSGTFALGAFNETLTSVSLQGGTISSTTGVLTSATAIDAQNGTVSAILGGTVGINKTTSGTVTLSGLNTYTGLTAIDAGILNAKTLATINTASSIGTGSAGGSAADIVFGGGTLQYSTAAIATTDRLFTIGDANGNSATIDSSATSRTNTLSFTNTGSIAFANTATHSLTLTGINTGSNLFAPLLTDQSAGNATSLTVSSSGTWVLTNNNTYTGGTSISSGILQIGAGGTTGAIGTGGVTDNGTLVFDRTDSYGGALSSSISGTGGITLLTGTLTAQGTNLSYTGTTTVSGGTLKLDFSQAGAPTTNIISSSSSLALGGGTLTITGNANTTNSQTFNGLTLNVGASSILDSNNATANPLLIALGALTRNTGGILNFTQPTGTINATNGFTTSSTNVNGILGGWATVSGSNWATNNGTNIVALSTYTTTAAAGTTAASYLNNNIDVTSQPSHRPCRMRGKR